MVLYRRLRARGTTDCRVAALLTMTGRPRRGGYQPPASASPAGRAKLAPTERILCLPRRGRWQRACELTVGGAAPAARRTWAHVEQRTAASPAPTVQTTPIGGSRPPAGHGRSSNNGRGKPRPYGVNFPHWGEAGPPADTGTCRTTGGGKPRPYGANHPPDLADTSVCVRTVPPRRGPQGGPRNDSGSCAPPDFFLRA